MKRKVHQAFVEDVVVAHQDAPAWEGMTAGCLKTHERGGIALYKNDGTWKGVWPDTTPERAVAFLGLVCDAEHVLSSHAKGKRS